MRYRTIDERLRRLEALERAGDDVPYVALRGTVAAAYRAAVDGGDDAAALTLLADAAPPGFVGKVYIDVSPDDWDT